MKKYDAYLFDADGTIIDTRQLICDAFMSMAAELGVTVASERVQATIGLPMTVQLRELLGHEHPDAYYVMARSIYNKALMQQYDGKLRAFPGVAEGLRQLQKLGKRLAVVTSRSRDSLDAFLQELQLASYFEVVVTAESTVRNKPHPDPALYAAELLGVAPQDCLFIGDAVFDIQSAKAASMDSVLVEWGGMDPSDWPVQPEYIISSFDELFPE